MRLNINRSSGFRIASHESINVSVNPARTVTRNRQRQVKAKRKKRVGVVLDIAVWQITKDVNKIVESIQAIVAVSIDTEDDRTGQSASRSIGKRRFSLILVYRILKIP